jgi:predicted esterase
MHRANGFVTQAPNPIHCTFYLPRVRPRGTLLFLHGQGECGTDATLPLTTGLPEWVVRQPARWPVAIVVPQKPDPERPWCDYEDAVLAHLDACVADAGLPAGPVALTGMSQGGHGALHLAARHPERFLGVAAVCGFAVRDFAADPSRAVARLAEGLQGLPVRLVHGEADTVVPVTQSQRIHAALAGRNAAVQLETLAGVGHDAWDHAYGRSDLPEWLVELL